MLVCVPAVSRLTDYYQYLVMMDGDMIFANTCVSLRQLVLGLTNSEGSPDILMSERANSAAQNGP